MTATGFGRSASGGGQQGRWVGGPGGGRTAGPARAGGRAGGGGAGGADEAAAEALRLVAEFPRPQRLYVLFLEAADSHRLNAHLTRCVPCCWRCRAAAGVRHRAAAAPGWLLGLACSRFARPSSLPLLHHGKRMPARLHVAHALVAELTTACTARAARRRCMTAKLRALTAGEHAGAGLRCGRALPPLLLACCHGVGAGI